MRKFIKILAIIMLMTIVSAPVSAMSSTSTISPAVTDTNELKISEAEKFLKEYRKDLQKNSELSKDVIEELVEARRQVEYEVYDSLVSYTEDVSALSPIMLAGGGYEEPGTYPTYTLGSDVNINSANEAKWSYGDDSDAECEWGYSPRNGIYSYNVVGQETPWAWTGMRFRLSGSTQDTVTITAAAVDTLIQIYSFSLGSSANANVYLKLFDATTGTYVFQESIGSETVVGAGGYSNFTTSGDYSKTATVTGNHVYVLFIQTSGTASFFAQVGGSSSSPLQGTEWYQFKLRY